MQHKGLEFIINESSSFFFSYFVGNSYYCEENEGLDCIIIVFGSFYNILIRLFGYFFLIIFVYFAN